MQCKDTTTGVYYPRHDEYVGPRDDLRGRCVRCGEITDPSIARDRAEYIVSATDSDGNSLASARTCYGRSEAYRVARSMIGPGVYVGIKHPNGVYERVN